MEVEPSKPNKPALTLEQEFVLRSFETIVERMTEAQAKDFLIKFHTHTVIREAYLMHLLGQRWGICAD